MEQIYLDKNHSIDLYRSVAEFSLDEAAFAHLWNEHPADYHEIVMHGKKVKTPRWQQSYGKSYRYTGSINNALPLADYHQKYLRWSRENVDERVNGLLINWYDGQLQHYMGKHRDVTKGLLPRSPIITVSHGGTRKFRFRPFKGTGYQDVLVENGDALVIPHAVNERFTHEVPYHKGLSENRISVTLRAYE